MRFSPPVIGLALLLATVSSASNAKRPDAEINPLSVTLTNDGKAALGAGQYDAAIDALETALAVDPKNRQAFMVLAEVARKQGLPGKAVRYYREALLIEPNDVVALAGQGQALVQRGALAKARENLARIGQLCAMTCTEQTALAAAIDKGAAAPVVSAQSVQPKPIVTETPKP